MLQHLNIQNYALISHLDIDFAPGFTVLTGETGAGKSILLGALALLMGERADSRAITEGEQKCVVEGEFLVRDYGLQALFEENDWDYRDVCTIRRELTAAGKSRSFVNDTPVTLAPLRTLTSKLIDIHSQHANLLLESESFALDMLDSVADNRAQRDAYHACYAQYKQLRTRLQALKEEAAQTASEQDYLRFSFEQLSEAQLVAGEMEELEAELEQLTHSDEIRTALARIAAVLDDEGGVLSLINQARGDWSSIQGYLHDENGVSERLESAYIDLKDIAAEASSSAERIDLDPMRQQWVEERLSLLHSLLQKHHLQDLEQLIALRDALDEKLQSIDSFDMDIELTERELGRCLSELKQYANNLTESRTAVIRTIEGYIETALQQLGIQHANFEVALQALPDFSPYGQERAELFFAANKNQSLRPVQAIASGGEMARLMLAIKSLVADKQVLPTIIFDEVDTGVSGAVAGKMGEMLRDMASHRQVLAITHLPQIAAKGNQHYRVYKADTDVRTETCITPLTQEERVVELAKLLSGDTVSEAALSNAKQLINS